MTSMRNSIMNEQSELEESLMDTLLCGDLLEKAPEKASEKVDHRGSKIPNFNETNDLR